MDTDLSTFTAWSYGLAGLGFGAFALQLGLGWRGGVHRLALFVAVAASACWGLLGLAFAVTQQAVLLTSAAFADILRAGGWYGLLLLILGPRGRGEHLRTDWVVLAASGIVVAGFAAQGMLALQVRAFGDSGWFALLHSLVVAVFGLVLVEQLLRSVPAESQWNIKPLCLGLACAFIFDTYLYADALLLSRIDTHLFSVRGLVHALVIPLVAIAAARNRDWFSSVALSRRLVFHSACVVVSGVCLLFVLAGGYYIRFLGGEWGHAFQVAVLFAGLLVFGMLALSGAMRAKLRVLVNKHFFSYRYDYREEWLRFTQTLSTCNEQSAMGHQIIRGLAQLVESPSGGLWLKDAEGRHYAQYACWNMATSGAIEQVDGPLLQFLGESGWVINLEEYRSFPGRYVKLELPPWLSEIPNAWLIVPLAGGGRLTGFVVLATARTRMDVDWEVNDLLKTAGRQAASFLGQMQATETLFESRKFDAFNRMSAFLVHDMKNIIAKLSLTLKNAERHRGNPEFEQDMRIAAESVVDSMKQLMTRLRDGSPLANVSGGVNLTEIIRRVQRSKAGQEPIPELQLEEGLITRGNDERVERVIGHIVQNAIDATDRSGRVSIRLQRNGEQAMVEVGDTGHGMSVEFMRERLFKPFQTTKSSGMGIGAYESYQYVQELGGRVLVDSSPADGTRVRLLLPLCDSGSITSDIALHREVA